MEALGLTIEMMIVLSVLALTVGLFVTEIVRVDVAAIGIMVLLGCIASLPGLESVVDVSTLFYGFGSNAVISIIAVMVIGAGLDKTGVMSAVAVWITRVGGSTESRIVVLISSVVGFISSFMQNVGAAALFLPVVSRISVRTGLPMSRLLMPMGFCAILGGTMTMVGSSPLILLNDLILGVNATLAADQQMNSFGLFDVTPIGLALVVTGILYFVVFGRVVLPAVSADVGAKSQSLLDYFSKVYNLDGEIHEIDVPDGTALAGKSIDELETTYRILIVATHYNKKTFMAPPRDVLIETPARLAVIGARHDVEAFHADFGLAKLPELDQFSESLGASKGGIAEVVIPPNSSVIGKTGREIVMRRVYGLSPLVLYRAGDVFTRGKENLLGNMPYQAGDTLVCHTSWESLARLEKDRDFVVVTTDYPKEELRPQKVAHAMVFFLIALALILGTDLRLSLCLLVGALGMVVSRVLSIQEAYEAVGWNTVFLLASLIPLGQAVQNTGTAQWIADLVLGILDGMPIWTIQSAVAVLATVFTLVMSNVGATVLLVPLAVNIALGVGADPALFALTVAISTSNSFLIPTHQVNALTMGPGGYSVPDFMRAGGVMTVLFLVVSITMLNLFF
ncbi:transporter, divalent anion:Na+ symporter (DASS) family [Tritonibacter multivorans]|uniref:Transporter, divalent anion:Na+ symporter (DASS) family n=1 Tax=Tritonibacter multivorans TaxID=928856 RepID=A0A0P1GSR9_9RHOB|nr:SLC13 family permease [Tritonibacter multivorans]MDA7422869.1 SLC13 family permease [Tritonibacter multivorans]CUH78246.1 transporter, divalent anion:Na+ symporter (DASS) family [Tritonibacter multivorans]SFD62549.1 Citrate transporter [Tritonibacter multivorans]